MTGGSLGIEKLSRKQCIDLCLQGYHSTDLERREMLKSSLKEIGDFHFDLIDTDHDG